MRKINHKQLRDVLKIAYKARTPLMIHGTMGIGKSQSVREVCREIAEDGKLEFYDNEMDGDKAFCFIDVRISQLDPSDLRGLPSIQDGSTTWLPPSWLPKHPKSRGILFFDELNLAPPSIQASAYQLILDRRLGEYRLPDGWIIISAGNTSDDRASIFELPAPLANRFIHIELSVPTKDEWTEWALANNVNGNIISFLELKPSFLYTFNKNNKDKAFATPRTWEYTNRLMNISGTRNFDELEIIISASVGEAIATEFIAHMRLVNQINIDDLLDNPERVKEINSLDLKYSLLGAIVEKYRADSKILPKAINVCLNMEPEFAILLLRFLKSTQSSFVKEVIKLPTWKLVFNKYGKYLIDLQGDK